MARWGLLCLGLCWGLLVQAETLPDPTRPLRAPQGAADANASTPALQTLPVLQGILLGNGPAKAWFNGVAWRVGDVVQGYRIRAITAHQVWLERDGQRIPLSVYSDKVKIQ